MPAPVRRSLVVLSCVALLALGLAAVAAAGNGGLAPPAPATPSASGIRSIYWLILAITGGIFVLVETALLLFIFRYRSAGRPRAVEGPQVIGHTNLEIAWTVAPVLILAAIAAFVFAKAAGIRNAPAAAVTKAIRIEGHQFYWQFDYPNGAVSVDTMRIPYNRRIELEIVSADVAHSWWVPALGGKMDAIPGRVNSMSFRANKLGAFPGQCAEFCGIQHTMMKMTVRVVPPAEYDSWVRQRKTDLAAVGHESFQGVCAKCHGLAGQGDIGPPISQSPILADPRALTKLLRSGGIKMPAVGKTWSDEQLKAVIDYLGKRFGSGGGSGG